MKRFNYSILFQGYQTVHIILQYKIRKSQLVLTINLDSFFYCIYIFISQPCKLSSYIQRFNEETKFEGHDFFQKILCTFKINTIINIYEEGR